MMRPSLTVTMILTFVVHFPKATVAEMPTAHYHKSPNDPNWLSYAAQFHGHLGPWATAGLRIGMAGREAVGAKGYFDIDVTVMGPFVKPPKSCFLDGLQVSTGATWGKRNIRWVKDEKIIVRVQNTRSSKMVEIQPTPELINLLESMNADAQAGPRDHHALEHIARKIAMLPQAKLVLFKSPDTANTTEVTKKRPLRAKGASASP